MSQIKLEVAIDVTNTVQVEALNIFLKVLGNNAQTADAPVKRIPASKAATKKVEEIKVEAPEVVSPAAEASQEEDSTIKIEEVRALLSKKVANHRDAIKNKLTELGANNVTSLDKKYYQAFTDFLNSLS